ncbi:MAG: FAD-dependent oxidoreductase [Novosphingobium sp.]|jgi:dimethylglycine dehydrogenase|uniref:GcvT family protein n=1 Tax=Novosphingobium sp. TaxID=1874826 RepID=UPI003015E988
MKTTADVVIIGGGVTGCSIAYHLARAGIKDVVLLERTQLTAGSTWHAAGGTGAFGGSANATFLHKYSFEMYPKLEAETGQSCGFHHVGEISIGRTDERVEEMKLHHVLAKRNGVETHWLTAEQLLEKAPVMDPATVKAALFEPSYGHVDPSGVTYAFAAGARAAGAQIVLQTPVLETNQRPDLSWDVVTPQGTIHAQRIVNAAGLWAREVAQLAGVYLPLMPVEHHYLVTESIPEIEALGFELPLITDADAEYYMRQEMKGLLLGVYESPCTHWAERSTPLDFGHELLPNAVERIESNLMQAVESVPCLGRAGIKRVINGPMIFSPDLAPLIGPYPGKANYWTACGVMSGFSQSAAIGMVLAAWMTEREPPMDVFMWDVARYGRWAGKDYVRARTGDMYATRFKTVYPYEAREAGRPVRTTNAYETLQAKGAVSGASDGLEFPLWYAPKDVEARDSLTYRRPNWFAPVGAECRGTAAGVGLIDISTYGKHRVAGSGALGWLERMMANRMPAKDGQIALTPMLSPRGRLLGEFSVARLAADEFILTGSGSADRFHHRYWQDYLPASGVEVHSLTASHTGFSISGPNARALLGRLTDEDVSAETLPYAKVRRIAIGPTAEAILMRLAYTGELGFEILLPGTGHRPLLDALLAAGADLGLTLAGVRALDAMRIEKGYGAWWLEYSPDYDPVEAGMSRLLKFDKGEFVGRAAALAARDTAPRRHYTMFDIDTDNAEPWGGEPVVSGDAVVGFITSAAFGHRVGHCVALGYLDADAGTEDDLQVEILGDNRPARVRKAPAYDPAGLKMRS